MIYPDEARPSRSIGRRERNRGGVLITVIAILIVLFASRYIASTVIDYSWWSEVHQVDTWLSLLLYGTGPLILTIVLFFCAFWIAFKLGLRHWVETPPDDTERARGGATNGLRDLLRGPVVSKLAMLAFAVLAIIAANATVDSWTVVKYFGGLRLPVAHTEFVDPIFAKPLHFYFFALPFYSLLLRVALAGAVLVLLIYWAASNLDHLARQLGGLQSGGGFEFERNIMSSAFHSKFIRLVAAIVLVGLAIRFYFSRYGFLLEDHGSYLVGVDWVADHLVLPLQWLMILGALAAAALVLARRAKLALVLLLILPVRYIVPAIVTALYVRPNELALETPYIQHHIDATRSAYGLNQRVTETTLEAAPEIPIDYAKHKALLDNVRLWDWRAFHDTISQIQPLRPYVYHDTDIDRYTIDGQIRQVLISARELEIRQLGPASTRWINTHLIYTHGYGIVMAEANRITADGLPVLFVKDAPPVVTTSSLKFTKPELYYSEIAHEPLFVDTAQPEFNYPSGSQSVYTTYSGTGGFPVSSFGMRLVGAVAYGDLNLLVSSYLTDRSRMMIRRQIVERLQTLAGFLTWDSDPYLVLTNAGRLVWIVDGYMSSDAHPYSREMDLPNGQTVNYIRNSIKATIDAYTGEMNLYVFDPGDVLIQAYWRLFPKLFKPVSEMPADLRAHARYPETLFSAQAEIYRTFHMRDAESFYNRADLWDLAKTASRQGEMGKGDVSPTYVVATLPGSDTPEFMLLTAFTPANKENLIGVMYARCDGGHLGELVFEQLSKQNFLYGPTQIDARINQDQNISKDLTLWNQQGSQVLRPQMLVVPIDNSFLYVEPLYIQASQTSMPQLKKVALAMGDQLAYADTYEQALGQLMESLSRTAAGGAAGGMTTAGAPQRTGPSSTAANTQVATFPATAASSSQAAETIQQIRVHLQRYRELSAQGKWADAGKELDDIQKLVQK